VNTCSGLNALILVSDTQQQASTKQIELAVWLEAPRGDVEQGPGAYLELNSFKRGNI
jgi:hypothetical protein